jgi:hypothetical protein
MTEAAMYHGAMRSRYDFPLKPTTYDLTPRHRGNAIALFPLPYCKNSLGESGAVVRRLSGFS